MLFKEAYLGNMLLRNRMIRSATAERMADNETGLPLPKMESLYKDLAKGGIGLIISGHLYVHPWGKCHPEMTAIDRDEVIPALKRLTDIVHEENCYVAAQINFGGALIDPSTGAIPLSPGHFEMKSLLTSPREITTDEIETVLKAFVQAGRRAKEAGFDAVQVHAAHGYFISQMLSPLVNQRDDIWGGSLINRTRFLKEALTGIREKVGADYPLLIKLGMEDGIMGGLSLQEGLDVLREIESWNLLQAVELSHGLGGALEVNIPKSIKTIHEEGWFRKYARKARKFSDLSLILVGGFRSCNLIEATLLAGTTDFISMSRPLICEPDLPNKLISREQKQARCISCGKCWPKELGVGISCTAFPDDKI